MKKILFSTLVFLLGFTCQAQENKLGNSPKNSALIYKQLKKLGFLGSVLYVAAHPDDENTRLISYLSNERNARTAYLSLTRGDGGQNLIGSEIREQLGMIRTQELLEARNIDGGIQFFTRANDFGYSKNPTETLEIWDENEVMSDVVRIIRSFQPDIIINRFNHLTPGSTHGHHTASAMLSVEAFNNAGDSGKFKDQLSTLKPWSPERMFFNTSWWFYGSEEAFEKADKTNLLSIDAGTYFPSLGISNNEIAALSRSKHKSQGFGSTGTRGEQTEYIEYLKGSFPSNKNDLFSGINTTWTRVSGGTEIQKLLDQVIANYDFKNPAASINGLLMLKSAMDALPEGHWKEIKSKDLEEIIINSLGLYLKASTSQVAAVSGSTVPLLLELTNRSATRLKIDLSKNTFLSDRMKNEDSYTLEAFDHFKKEIKLHLSKNKKSSTPYWLEKPGTMGMYSVDDHDKIGTPENQPEVAILATVSINNLEFTYSIPVVYQTNDPVRGEVNEPFYIVPELEVSVKEDMIIFNSDTPKTVAVEVRANQNHEGGTLQLEIPNGWKTSPKKYTLSSFVHGSASQTQNFDFNITPPSTGAKGFITPVVTYNGKKYDHEVIRISYEHIADQQLVRKSETKIVKPQLVTKATHIAYITGAGDSVPEALSALGCEVSVFTPEQLPVDVTHFDAILLGIRAYNVHEDISVKQQQLFDYVKNGGTLITQYNTSRGLKVSSLGPYPITLSRKRVTDENAQVTFIHPDHKVLNYPNTITAADFNNWVQERGLYFPEEWDAAYTPILGMNDPGEEMTKGSLLVAEHGKGYFVYTGISFFRELPAGVEGAYRLMANLISLGK